MNGLGGEGGASRTGRAEQGGVPALARGGGLSTFARECGHPGPILLQIEGPGADLAKSLATSFEPPCLIAGRGPQADLNLADPKIAPRQAYLQAIGGRILVLDLWGEGLFLDDRPVPWCWLDAAVPTRIGPYILRPAVEGESPSPAFPNPLSSKPPAHADLPPLSLEFPGRGAKHPPWVMRSALALCGRSPNCKVRIDDPGLSRYQIALVRTPDGPWLVDLRGKAGVFHNGKKVRATRLEEGDEIRVGRHRLAARLGASSDVRLPEGRALARLDRTGTVLAPPGGPGEGPLVASWVEPIRPMLPADAPEWLAPMLGQWAGQIERMQREMFEQFQQAILGMARLYGGLHADGMDEIRGELERIGQLGEELRSIQGPGAPESEVTPSAKSTGGSRAVSDPATAGRRQDARTTQAETSNWKPRDDPREEAVRPADELHTDLARKIAALRGEQQGRWQRVLSMLVGRP